MSDRMKGVNFYGIDEATAYLDAYSEAQVQTAIYILVRGKTVWVIEHIIRTIEAVDKIFMLKNGIVV